MYNNDLGFGLNFKAHGYQTTPNRNTVVYQQSSKTSPDNFHSDTLSNILSEFPEDVLEPIKFEHQAPVYSRRSPVKTHRLKQLLSNNCCRTMHSSDLHFSQGCNEGARDTLDTRDTLDSRDTLNSKRQMLHVRSGYLTGDHADEQSTLSQITPSFRISGSAFPKLKEVPFETDSFDNPTPWNCHQRGSVEHRLQMKFDNFTAAIKQRRTFYIFNTWKMYALDNAKVKQFHRRWLLKRVMDAMKRHAGDRQNAMQLIKVHVNNLLICKHAFRAWAWRTNLVRIEKENIRQAISHHQQGLVRRCFGNWKFEMQKIRKSRHFIMTLINIRNQALMHKFWNAWQTFCFEERRIRACFENVRDRQRILQLRGAFAVWRRRAEQYSLATKFSVSSAFARNQILLHKILTNWHMEVEREKLGLQHKELLVKAKQKHRKVEIKALHFNAWLYHVKQCKSYRIAHRAANQRIMSNAFEVWRDWIAELKQRDIMLQQAYCFRATHLKSYFFLRWIHAEREVQRIRQLDKVSLCHWVLTLEAKYWKCWKVYLDRLRAENARVQAAYHRYTARLAKTAVGLIVEAANRLKLTRIRAMSREQASALKCYQMWLGCISNDGSIKHTNAEYQICKCINKEYNDSDSSNISVLEKEACGNQNLSISKPLLRIQPKIPDCLADMFRSYIHLETKQPAYSNNEHNQNNTIVKQFERANKSLKSTIHAREQFRDILLAKFYENSAHAADNLSAFAQLRQKERELIAQISILKLALPTTFEKDLLEEILFEIETANIEMFNVRKEIKDLRRRCSISLSHLGSILS